MVSSKWSFMLGSIKAHFTLRTRVTHIEVFTSSSQEEENPCKQSVCQEVLLIS